MPLSDEDKRRIEEEEYRKYVRSAMEAESTVAHEKASADDWQVTETSEDSALAVNPLSSRPSAFVQAWKDVFLFNISGYTTLTEWWCVMPILVVANILSAAVLFGAGIDSWLVFIGSTLLGLYVGPPLTIRRFRTIWGTPSVHVLVYFSAMLIFVSGRVIWAEGARAGFPTDDVLPAEGLLVFGQYVTIPICLFYVFCTNCVPSRYPIVSLSDEDYMGDSSLDGDPDAACELASVPSDVCKPEASLKSIEKDLAEMAERHAALESRRQRPKA